MEAARQDNHRPRVAYQGHNHAVVELPVWLDNTHLDAPNPIIDPGSDRGDLGLTLPRTVRERVQVSGIERHDRPGVQLIAHVGVERANVTYSALLDHFKLAPDERDYLEKLLMEKQMVQVNLGMQMLNASLSPQERGALGRQIQQGMQDSEAKIKTFLNDDQDYGYFQSYAQQEPERLEVGMFTQSVGGLDATTSEALETMLNDSRNSYPFTVNFYDHRNFGNPAVLNSAAINQFLDEQTKFQADVAEKASTLLTPAQQEAFKQNQAAVRQMTKMQLNSIIQLTGTGQ